MEVEQTPSPAHDAIQSPGPLHPRAPSAPALVERAAQVHRVERLLLDSRSGHGGALLITSAGGLGRTAFLRHVTRAEQTRRGALLTASCSPLEQEIPMGALGQLLSAPHLPDPLRAEARELVAQGRAALRPAGPDGAGGDEVPPEVLDGLHRVLVRLGQDDPVTIAVDDVHAIDEASLHGLGYVIRRAHGMRLLVLLAERESVPAAPPLWRAELVRQGHLQLLRLPPLSQVGTEEVLARSDPPLPPGMAADLHRTSGGNPLLLHSLIADLHDAATPQGYGVAGGQHYQEAVATLLNRSEPCLMRVAQALALLPDFTHAPLLDLLLEVPVGTAAQAVGALAALGLVQAGEFRHPRIRAALLSGLTQRDTLGGGRGAQSAEPLGSSAEFAPVPPRFGADDPGRDAPRPEHGLRALSDAERRVAELAARGQTNREISRRLFVTVSTVEQHLTRTYRKLGVRDRRDLPAELRSDSLTPR